MSNAAGPWRNSRRDYGWVAMALHWGVAALVGWQLWLGLTAADLPLGIERLKLLARHKSTGLLILALMLLRLGWRQLTPPPPLAEIPAWQRRAAGLSHALLYLLLIAMPLVGWASSSAADLTVSIFGWFRLPDILPPNRALAEQLVSAHALMAWLLMGLLGVHISAALWHHFWRRDAVLRRMLPRFRKPE